MRKQHGIVLIVAIIFIALIAASMVGVAYIYQHKKNDQKATINEALQTTNSQSTTNENANTNSNSNVNASTNTNSDSTNTNAAVSTVDWKLYTSEQYGFSFSYPKDWKVTLYTKDQEPYNSDGIAVEDPAGKDGKFVWMNKGVVLYQDGEWATVVKSMSVDGKVANKSTATAKDPNSFLVKPTTRSSIGMVNTPPGWNEEARIAIINGTSDSSNVLDLILATFKINDLTADWKTYTNADIGYSFKYPKNWTVKETNEKSEILDKQVRYVTVTNSSTNNFLHLGIRKVGNTVALTDRTGVGAGDFSSGDTKLISTVSIEAQNLVYKNKVKEVWYHKGSSPAKVNGFEVLAEFSSNATYDSLDLTQSADYATVNTLLATIDTSI